MIYAKMLKTNKIQSREKTNSSRYKKTVKESRRNNKAHYIKNFHFVVDHKEPPFNPPLYVNVYRKESDTETLYITMYRQPNSKPDFFDDTYFSLLNRSLPKNKRGKDVLIK